MIFIINSLTLIALNFPVWISMVKASPFPVLTVPLQNCQEIIFYIMIKCPLSSLSAKHARVYFEVIMWPFFYQLHVYSFSKVREGTLWLFMKSMILLASLSLFIVREIFLLRSFFDLLFTMAMEEVKRHTNFSINQECFRSISSTVV